MNFSLLLILLLLVWSASLGQVPARAISSDLQIVKHDWSKDRIAWEKDPFGTPNESYSEMRERVRTERRPKSALEERTIRDVKAQKDQPFKPPRYTFNYVVTVSNVGSKTIKEIDWDYVFADAVTGEELGRQEFTSVEKVGPGKKKQLSVRVSSPPTKLISVHAQGTNERAGLAEQVLILRILYEDGTVWNLQ